MHQIYQIKTKQDRFQSGVAKLVLGISVLKSLIYLIFLKLFHFFQSYFISFHFIYFLFCFSYFFSFYFIVVFVLNYSIDLSFLSVVHWPLKRQDIVPFLWNNSIIHLSSFFIMNIRTNRKWNYGHVSVLPFFFASCS